MACTGLARGAAGAQLQGVAAPRAARPARLARVVCRAEEKASQKVEKAVDKVSEKVEQAAGAVSKAVDKASDKTSKAVTKAADRTNDFLFFSSKASWGYLDGSRPGDFGFDPLGLLEPANRGGFINPEWLTYSEIIHCRFAMLGAAGMIGPEILGKANLIPQETNLAWFTTGVIPPAGTYGNYWTDPWSLFWIEILAMQFAELRRWQDFRKPGSMGKQYFLGLENSLGGSGNPSYPGGSFFNVFNLGGESEQALNKLKTNEVRNGRLAMLAVLGYGAQATITRVGPFQNLLDHLSDPTHNNVLANFGKVYGQ